MLDAIPNELLPIVLGLVESNDMSNPKVLEDLQVVLGAVAVLFLPWATLDRAHKGYELARHHPVEVAVLYLLVVLVLLGVEIAETVPPQLDCKLQTLQGVINLRLKV